MSRLASFPVKSTVFSGDFSIIAALPSLAEPINMDSETNVSRFWAMAKASSIVAAYCRISLVRMEMGVAEPVGTADLAALIVTVSPVSFMPDNTPIIPGHPTEANLYPCSGT